MFYSDPHSYMYIFYLYTRGDATVKLRTSKRGGCSFFLHVHRSVHLLVLRLCGREPILKIHHFYSLRVPYTGSNTFVRFKCDYIIIRIGLSKLYFVSILSEMERKIVSIVAISFFFCKIYKFVESAKILRKNCVKNHKI